MARRCAVVSIFGWAASILAILPCVMEIGPDRGSDWGLLTSCVSTITVVVGSGFERGAAILVCCNREVGEGRGRSQEKDSRFGLTVVGFFFVY